MALAPTVPPPATTAAAPRSRPAAGRGRRRGIGPWFALAAAVVVGAVMVSPFLLIVLNALKSPADYAANGPLTLPSTPDLTGVVAFWERFDFPAKLANSVLIAGSVAVAAVAVSVCSAYALGIGRVRGRTSILVVFLLATMLPQEALIYPLYTMANWVGLYDTQLSVIIIFTAVQSAFGTYLLSSVYGSFPREILEAAQLDGAGRLRTLWSVVLPISRPTIGVLMVFFFIWTWNEFLIPLVFLAGDAHQTVPIAISALQGDKLADVTTTSAAALLGVLPTLVFFLIFQRTLARGITAGATK
jgi:raffinose/stachyose/melibiose transport system permease protein